MEQPAYAHPIYRTVLLVSISRHSTPSSTVLNAEEEKGPLPPIRS